LGTDQNKPYFYENVTSIRKEDGVPNTIFDSFFATEEKFNAFVNTGSDIWRNPVRYSLFGLNQTGDPTEEVPLGLGADIMLASSRYIYTFGDIVPMVDGLNNIGSWLHNFGELHIDTIVGSDVYTTTELSPGLITDTRHINVNGALLPVNNYNDLGDVYKRWNVLYAKQLGTNDAGDQSDWIDTGYIKTINVNIITAQTITTTTLTCLDINNMVSLDNLQGNINIATINGLDISLYLNENSNATIYSFSLYLNDGTYNISRTYSGGGSDGFKDTGYLFSFTIAAEIKDENFTSLILRFPSENLKITKNSRNWDDDGWKTLLYTDEGDFKQLLVDTYGETIVNNTIFTAKDSNEVSVASSYSVVNGEYKTKVRFESSNIQLQWQMDLDNKKYSDDDWFGNNGEIVLQLI